MTSSWQRIEPEWTHIFGCQCYLPTEKSDHEYCTTLRFLTADIADPWLRVHGHSQRVFWEVADQRSRDSLQVMNGSWKERKRNIALGTMKRNYFDFLFFVNPPLMTWTLASSCVQFNLFDCCKGPRSLLFGFLMPGSCLFHQHFPSIAYRLTPLDTQLTVPRAMGASPSSVEMWLGTERRYKEDEVPRSLWKDVLKSLPHGCFSGGSSIDGWWFRFTVLCWLIHYAWTDFEYAWIKLIVSREKYINSIIVISLSTSTYIYINIFIYLSIDIPHVLVLIFLCELAIQERTAHIPCSQNQVCFFIPLRVHMGLYSHLPHCSGEKELSGIQSHQTSWMAIRPSTGVESVIYRVGQWCLMLITAIVVNKKDLIVIPWRLHTAETMMIITKCELLVFFFSCSARWIPNFQLVYHYFKYQ